MKEIGRILQEQREAKGLTLKEVQAATKIRQRYLEALEAGELSVLPAEVYARGFLRTYAEFLGLDSRELLARYADEGAKTEVEEAQKEAHKERLPARRRAERPGPATPEPLPPAPMALGSRTIWLGVLLVLLVAAGWALLRVPGGGVTSGPGSQVEEPASGSAEGTPPEEAGPPEPAEPEPVEPEPAEPEPEPVRVERVSTDGAWVYEVTGGEADEGLEVTLVAEGGDCWIGPRLDGEPATALTLRAAESRTWRAGEQIRMVLGNPPAVRIIVNGVDLGTPDTVEVLTLVFERK